MNESDARCVVCFALWNDVNTKITSCGVLLCGECKRKLTLCPVCRCPLNQYHILQGTVGDLAKKHYRSVVIKCELGKCEEKIPSYDLQHHRDTNCIGAMIKCSECKVEILRMDKQKHLNEQCDHRLVNCEDCGMEMYANCLSTHHSEMCEFVMIACSNLCCEVVCERMYLAQHIANECQFTVMKCPQNARSAEFKRLHTKAHFAACQFTNIVCKHCKMTFM